MKLVTLCAVSLLALRAGELVRVDTAGTHVEWTLGTLVHTVHGTFKLKRGDLDFDPSSGKVSGQFVVDATSGESGNGARDGRMHKSILESAKFPEIVFTPDRFSGALKANGDSDVQLHGSFLIHGAAHEVTFPAKVHRAPGTLTAEMEFSVPYIQWGMKNPSTLFLRVDDTVKIVVHAVGRVSPATTP